MTVNKHVIMFRDRFEGGNSGKVVIDAQMLTRASRSTRAARQSERTRPATTLDTVAMLEASGTNGTLAEQEKKVGVATVSVPMPSRGITRPDATVMESIFLNEMPLETQIMRSYFPLPSLDPRASEDRLLPARPVFRTGEDSERLPLLPFGAKVCHRHATDLDDSSRPTTCEYAPIEHLIKQRKGTVATVTVRKGFVPFNITFDGSAWTIADDADIWPSGSSDDD